MKKLSMFLMAAFLIAAVAITGCKKDENPEFDGQKALREYLVAQNLDLNTILSGFVMDTPNDVAEVAGKYIIDVRTQAEFAAGHIANAHRVDLADLLTEAAKADKPILVVCKSGQTATHAVALLRLSGYPDAKALKWGMSRWHADFDIWSANIASIADGHTNWTTDPAPANLTYEYPKFTSTSTDPVEILKERIALILSEGFKTVTPDAVIENPSNYFINNYFPEADYLGFGHIKGAFRINPLLIGEGQMNFLNPEKQIVTYCYTGQTSAAITAYLRVIGYDKAISMMWGMNRLFNSHSYWTSNKWSSGMVKNLPYETGN
jgi:rhodanese-related sulfurtransferase